MFTDFSKTFKHHAERSAFLISFNFHTHKTPEIGMMMVVFKIRKLGLQKSNKIDKSLKLLTGGQKIKTQIGIKRATCHLITLFL